MVCVRGGPRYYRRNRAARAVRRPRMISRPDPRALRFGGIADNPDLGLCSAFRDTGSGAGYFRHVPGLFDTLRRDPAQWPAPHFSFRSIKISPSLLVIVWSKKFVWVLLPGPYSKVTDLAYQLPSGLCLKSAQLIASLRVRSAASAPGATALAMTSAAANNRSLISFLLVAAALGSPAAPLI